MVRLGECLEGHDEQAERSAWPIYRLVRLFDAERAVQSGATTLSTSPLSSRPRRANIMSATRKASAGDARSRSISCSHCPAR